MAVPVPQTNLQPKWRKTAAFLLSQDAGFVAGQNVRVDKDAGAMRELAGPSLYFYSIFYVYKKNTIALTLF